MVLVGQVHVVPGPDVVADDDPFVGDDADPLAEHTAVADRDDRVAAHAGLRRHPGAQARERTDRRARADRDARLTEDHCRREGEHAAFTESVERAGAAVARADRAVVDDRPPRGMHRVAREAPDLVSRPPASSCKDTAVANGSALPIRIGLLYDFPQGDDLFVKSMQLGIDDVAATGRLDRDFDFVERQARGLPSGSEADIVRAFGELRDEGVLFIAGPSISDNALIAAPLCDEARIPAINYSGGERTRSQWMFHYQVGSLEEEPPVLAARMIERGLQRAAVLFDQSPVGRRYAECFEAARARLGLVVTATASIAPLADDAEVLLRRLRDSEPDTLVYFGLGVSSRGSPSPASRSAGTCPSSPTQR